MGRGQPIDTRAIGAWPGTIEPKKVCIPSEIVANASPLMRRLWGFEIQAAWEETHRNFKIVDAPGAKPRFDYNRRGQRFNWKCPE